MKSFTAFKSIFDNKTDNRFDFRDWDHFTTSLYSLSKLPGYKPKKGEFLTRYQAPAPLITPAIFNDNTTRANVNVKCWAGWIALDIDKYDGSFEDVMKNFSGYRYVCYSTASSTKEHPKFRVVLDPGKNIPADDIKHVWFAVNKHFNEYGDPQTKDLCRLYYVPAQYPNAFNFFFTKEGNQLDVNALMSKYEFSTISSTSFLSKLSPEMQKAILQHQKDKLTNTKIVWTTYRNCQFVNKNMVEEYRRMVGTGWYTKMYQIAVNIASNAVRAKYPITANQIATLCRQIDNETGGWYKNRPLEKEAARALEYILTKSLI